MMRKILFFIGLTMSVVASADEYTDPKTNVIYTYEPGQATASVKAGHDEVIDRGYGYELETVYYSGCPDAMGDVAILDRFTVGAEEFVVTSIGQGAFWGNKNIKSVSIPETVTDIGSIAFSLCDSLTTVHLPDGLTQISYGLFSDSRQLASVVIPSTVSAIGMYAFNNCISLNSLTLPAGLLSVGRGAFNDTPWYAAQYDEAPEGPFYIGSLLLGYKGDKPSGDLVIREGTTCIGFEAFHRCEGLTSVTFPKSIAFVDEGAFSGCTGLTAVHITDLAAWCGIEFSYEYRSSSNPLCHAHHLYLNGKEVTDLIIPEGVTGIGNYAFDNCTALSSITIPDGVTNIGTCAFRSCDKMTSVTIPPSLTTIDSQAFIWCHNLDAVYISDLAAWCGLSLYYAVSPLTYGAHLYLNGEEVTDLVIPDGVTSIGDGSFMHFSRLSSVTIPESVTCIGEFAFAYCSELTRISLPSRLDSIGYGAFHSCSSLTSITIPEGVARICGGTFADCYGLTTVTIPSSVRRIDYGAFRLCRALTSVISWIEEPFEIEDNVFELYNSETYELYFTPATLYVPKGCKERYEATAGWKNFSTIIEMEGSGIEDMRIPSFRQNDTDTAHPIGAPAAVYDLQGRRLETLPHKGIYIQDGKKKWVR